MDSFRYILYVYKRTILRASGREKDKSWFFNWTQSQHVGNMEKNGSLSTSFGGYVTSVIRYVQTAITNISSNVQPYISVYVWRRTA